MGSRAMSKSTSTSKITRSGSWYAMPWMDWNSEVAADRPGTDGREFVHGMTHEFDSSAKTLVHDPGKFVDTWSAAYYNDRAGFGIGQVYCDPDSPDPAALNPDPDGLNNFADGSYIIKLLFSTATDEQLPTMKNALEWQADIFDESSPNVATRGLSRAMRDRSRRYGLLQIDVAVRDDRSATGWLFGTFTYDGRKDGKTAYDRMVPLGLQWGNNPNMTYRETCDGSRNMQSEKIDTAMDRRGRGRRDERTSNLTRPSWLRRSSWLARSTIQRRPAWAATRQPAFPRSPLCPKSRRLRPFLGSTTGKTTADLQDFRMNFYRNVVSGVAFSDTQLIRPTFPCSFR